MHLRNFNELLTLGTDIGYDFDKNYFVLQNGWS